MRRILTFAFISLFLISFTLPAFADKDKHHRERVEHRGFSHSSGKHKEKDKHYKNERQKGHKDKDRKRSDYRHHEPPRPVTHHKAHRPHYSKQLERMVRYACRGGRDINVWEISPGIYMVKYFLNGHYYTQRLYPGSGRYGARGMINVNWAPSPGWSLLPSIYINIPIN